MRAALVAIEARTPLDARSIAVINTILAADEGTDRLEAHGDGYRIQRHHARDDATNALVPIARDVASLIVAPDAPVRRCAGDGCVRHFYDDSRTARRRWCEMAICGNRAKASAFTKRRRATE